MADLSRFAVQAIAEHDLIVNGRGEVMLMFQMPEAEPLTAVAPGAVLHLDAGARAGVLERPPGQAVLLADMAAPAVARLVAAGSVLVAELGPVGIDPVRVFTATLQR